MMRKSFAAAGLAAMLAFGSSGAFAADDVPTFEISIKDHIFSPTTLEVPAGKDVKLVVKNLDATPEEFESYDLNLEKIIAGGGEGTFLLAPLEKGDYKFFGEFHEDTAQGVLTAK
jgi:plastocyanin